MAETRIRLVAGLGNPGGEYAGTRHNAGFAAVELFARQIGANFERRAKWEAAVAKAGDVLVVEPLAYMNRSGVPLRAVADFYKIEPAEILVILDDLALPLGRIRMRERGGTAGHNGLESIIVAFGTEEIPRLRLGIGGPPKQGSIDYVLGRFFEEEMPQVATMLDQAVEATKCAIDFGVTSAMNRFNHAV